MGYVRKAAEDADSGMKTIFCTDFGDHEITPKVADRLNFTTFGQPDKRYRTFARDARYAAKIKAHVFHLWNAGSNTKFVV